MTHVTDGVTDDIVWIQDTRVPWFNTRLGHLKKEKVYIFYTYYILYIYIIPMVFILYAYYISFISYIFVGSNVRVI